MRHLIIIIHLVQYWKCVRGCIYLELEEHEHFSIELIIQTHTNTNIQWEKFQPPVIIKYVLVYVLCFMFPVYLCLFAVY